MSDIWHLAELRFEIQILKQHRAPGYLHCDQVYVLFVVTFDFLFWEIRIRIFTCVFLKTRVTFICWGRNYIVTSSTVAILPDLTIVILFLTNVSLFLSLQIGVLVK